MRAIFIDSKNETVSEWDYDGNYKNIQKKIGCRVFTVVGDPDSPDDLFVDDEGLFSLTPETKFFSLPWLAHPLCGNGVVLRCDDEGESIETTTELDVYRDAISFHDVNEVVAECHFQDVDEEEEEVKEI